MIFSVNRFNNLKVVLAILITFVHLVSFPAAQASDDLVLKDAKLLANPSPMYDAIYSPEALATLKTSTKKADDAYGISCDTNYSLEVIRLLVAQPIVISQETGKITEGLWFYRYQAERCDRTKTYNAVAVKRPASGEASSEIKYILFAPGMTEADPTLVRDTLKYVYPSTFLKSEASKDQEKKDCANKAILFDTEYLGEFDLGWKEKWTVQTCGELVSSEVTYTSDGKGGHYIAVR